MGRGSAVKFQVWTGRGWMSKSVLDKPSESELRELICEIGRRMYAKDLIAANEGNLSIRAGDRLLATPTGMCKGFMKPSDLVWTDLEGRQVAGERKVSTEILMHCVVYRLRPDVGAVCHGHPVYATAHAVAGVPLVKALMPEVVVTLGCVPVAPYGTPSTDELANSLNELVPGHDAVLLANHGAITYGPGLENAFFKMEILEHFAKITLLTKLIGRETLLSRESVDKLFEVRGKYGITSPDFRQAGCPVTADEAGPLRVSRQELEELVERVVTQLTSR